MENNERFKSSEQENDDRLLMKKLYEETLPRLGPAWSNHSLAFTSRQALSRAIYYNTLYEKIIEVPGVILEFGVQWGASLGLLSNLRAMYEPYNYSRTIFGFDTFEGFVGTSTKDGDCKEKEYAVGSSHQETLEQVLSIHERNAPLSHIKKFELIKGNASETIDEWLEGKGKSAVVAMAIFDMDIYKPTADVLKKIIPKLTKGSILVFDELNCPTFPGETEAVNEVLGLNNLRLRRFPHQTFCAWAEF